MNKIAVAMGMTVLTFLPGFASGQMDASTLTKSPLGAAALEFLDLGLNQKKVDEAIDKYLAPPYTQHNPQVPDGIEGARAALTGLLKQLPGWHYDFKRVLVDGDFVTIHSHVTTGSGDRGMAVVDIFRAENGKFVEHWDVVQPVPESAANENTMF
ncbi:MAG: polyketide cyclase [Mesorhizobium sp.]|uniref:nuclear transport factor 2 family protein n=1 Tax=Mesorhizobium sp. TaxID=1871066 RepID=UPI000FE5D93E|nr:nuclear transport factor 2 family protein [Mesorhizobium sp.]RWD46213.1 MAG: polyketide cyclase [Mesorhizobium sp.]RWE57345.1 MAG: polyketide cyclase [Mesorhizobium sp.]RWE66765.1 MAG: polyketide cyclase [Mesorhizobium sp.]RWF57115.1 MAG: polyketide cyclase [Mesorhizobium sp.]TIU94910.1 MAG: polyketide cyclase [Mesorhizobium sp.]